MIPKIIAFPRKFAHLSIFYDDQSSVFTPNFIYHIILSAMELKRFVKMHGAGNDFIIVEPQFFNLSNKRSQNDTFSPQEIAHITPIVIDLCRPHFAIGADGLLIVSDVGDRYKMSVFNSNGTTAPSCGNGLRCVAAYLSATKQQGSAFKVTTDSGDKEVRVFGGEGREFDVSINLGSPSPAQELPLELTNHHILHKYLQNTPIFHGGLGNSHIVIFLDDSSYQRIAQDNAYVSIADQLIKIKKANINFCCIDGRDSMRIVTCELGAGVTLACGTGSTTSAYIGHTIGKLDAVVNVYTRGGVLTITSEQKQGGFDLHLKGPAKWVFSGEIELK